MARPKAVGRKLRMTYPLHFHLFAALLHQQGPLTDIWQLLSGTLGAAVGRLPELGAKEFPNQHGLLAPDVLSRIAQT